MFCSRKRGGGKQFSCHPGGGPKKFVPPFWGAIFSPLLPPPPGRQNDAAPRPCTRMIQNHFNFHTFSNSGRGTPPRTHCRRCRVCYVCHTKFENVDLHPPAPGREVGLGGDKSQFQDASLNLPSHKFHSFFLPATSKTLGSTDIGDCARSSGHHLSLVILLSLHQQNQIP